ncbi:MAG: TonB-dependent receptor, partial [Acidobacteriota bacterium]
MTRSVLFLILLSAFIFLSNIGAQSITIKGRVVDTDGKPIAGATVVLRNKSNGIERTAAANNDGQFTFAGAADAAQFEIIAASNGFARIVKTLDSGAADVVLTLSPDQISANVTVTATRNQILTSDTAVPVSVVGKEELDLKGVNVIGDIFRTLPGTSTVNEGAFGVRPRIRGLDSNRVLILVDGERLNNSRTSTEQSGVETGLVDMSQIDSVEVVRGSGSVLYGTDALGGTINIITHDTPARNENGFRFGGVLNTFYSSNENGRRGSLAVNGSNKLFAFRVGQSLERFENYSTGKTNGTVPQDILNINPGGVTNDGEVLNSQSHGSDTNAMLRFFLNDTNTLKFGYDRRRAANIGSPTLVGVFNAFFPFSDRDKFNGRWDSAALTKNLQRLSVSGFYQKQNRNFTNILTVPPVLPFFPGLYQFSQTVTDTKTTGLDVQSDWVFGSRNNLTAGFSFFRDRNNDNRIKTTTSTPGAPIQSTDRSKSVPNANLTNVAGFAQDEFRISKRLKLIGGLRIDNFKTKADPTNGFSLPNLRPDQIADLGIGSLAAGLNVSNTAVTGDVGAVVRLTDWVNLSARVGRSFRTPNIFELFFTDAGSVGGFVVGNPTLKPETGTNFDTSIKLSKSRFSGTVTYFNNSYKNLLATLTAADHRGCPVYITFPGTVYDANNCQIVSSPPHQAPVQVYQTVNIGGFLGPLMAGL